MKDKPYTLTPLHALLMHDFKRELSPKTEQGALLLIDAQTGIGKTHVTLDAMTHYAHMLSGDESLRTRLIDSKESRFIVYYLSHSVDSVRKAYETVRKNIQTSESLSKEKKQKALDTLLYVPNNEGLFSNWYEHMQDEKDRHRFINAFCSAPHEKEFLHDCISRYEEESRYVKESSIKEPKLLKRAKEELSRVTQETFSALVKAIRKSVKQAKREKRPSPVNSLNPYGKKALSVLLPGWLIEENKANVVFLTTKKFLSGINALHRYRYDTRAENEHGILFIDEFDRQNEEILDYLLNADPFGMIEAMRKICSSVMQFNVRDVGVYQGVQAHFDKVKHEFKDFFEYYHLSNPIIFKDHKETMDGASVINLFTDKGYIHTANSIEGKIGLEHEPERLVNYVTRYLNLPLREKNARFEDLSDASFNEFMWEAQRLYDLFVKVLYQAVSTMRHNDEMITKLEQQKNVRPIAHTQEDEELFLFKLLSQLSLTDAEGFNALERSFRKEMKNFGQIKQLASIKARYKDANSMRNMHLRGFKLKEIKEQRDSHMVEAYDMGVDFTPTGILLGLIQRGRKVIGISATATAKTRIGNFDIDFLENALEEKYLKLNSNQKDAIQAFYNKRRNYERNGVKINVCTLYGDSLFQENDILAQALKEIYPSHTAPGFIDESVAKFYNIDNKDQGSIAHYRETLSFLLRSIEDFFKNPTNRYHLCLLNRSVLKEGKGARLYLFLEEYIQKLSEQYKTPAHLFGVNAQSLSRGIMNEVHDVLGAEKGLDRVILLSTYKTIGEAFNPQYTVHPKNKKDKARLIWVGDGPAPKTIQADVDSIYLESATNLLPSRGASNSIDWQTQHKENREDVLYSIYNILMLHEGCEFSFDKTHELIRKALDNLGERAQKTTLNGLRKGLIQEYKKTSDYHSYMIRIVEQALGRIARTAFKNQTISIYMGGGDVYEAIQSDYRPNNGLSHEYIALRKHIQETPISEVQPQSSMSLAFNDRARQMNLVAKKSNITLRELRNTFQNVVNAKEKDKALLQSKYWEAMRTWVLQYPTREEPLEAAAFLHVNVSESLAQAPTLPNYYYIKQGLSRYLDFYSRRKGGVPFNDYLILGEQISPAKFRPVSEQDSRLPILMQNDIIRAHFEAQSFATQWLRHTDNTGRVIQGHVLNPVAYLNIYLAALGEQAVEALFKHAGFAPHPLPLSAFEAADLVVKNRHGQSIAIDVKNWQANRDLDASHQKRHQNKWERLSKVGIDRLMFINLFKLTPQDATFNHFDHQLHPTSDRRAPVAAVSGLLNENGQIDYDLFEKTVSWIEAIR